MSTPEQPEPTSYAVTDRNRVRRRRDRARYDVETVHAILDAALLCHAAYVIDGQPYCTPTTFWRDGSLLYWHGSAVSRMLKSQATGIDVCLTVSHMDSLVLARSAFGHSINYRSAMVFGRATAIADPAEKLRAVNAFIDRVYPGRSAMIRAPSPQELNATAVLRMQIEQASAKIRAMAPHEEREEDYGREVWAGLIPLNLTLGAAVECERLPQGVTRGADLAAYREGESLGSVLTCTHRSRG